MKSAIRAALALSGWMLVSVTVSGAAAQPEVLPLYDGVAPGSESWTQREGAVEITNPTLLRPYVDTVVWNVTRPTLTVFRPAKGRGNGTAIVVAPGGGFRVLSYRNEGEAVAQYLTARGYTAFVLKYRLNQMPDDPAEIKKNLDAMAAGALAGRRPGPPAGATPAATPPGTPPAMPRMVLGPVELVRSRAAEFGIDANRVGIIGFSAGGAVSGNTAIGEGHRPDFVGIIYSNVAGPIPAGAPPAFMAAAADDPLSAAMPDLFARWRAAGAKAELHIYATGRHGFGMAQQGLPVDHWIESFTAWLEQQGFVPGKPHAEVVLGTAGPYPVQMEYDAAGHPEHTLYRPVDLAAVKGKLPFVAFGNGGCLNIGNLEKRFLAEVASYGYVVTAPGKIEAVPENFGPNNTGGINVTQAKPGQMRRAIDWAIDQATTGPWKGRVDPQRIGVMGASCGGLETIATGGDARVKSMVIFNSGIIRGLPPGMPIPPPGAAAPRTEAPAPADARPPMVMQLPGSEADLANLHTPVIYLIGGPRDIAYQASETDFTQIQRVPVFNANLDVGHAGTMGQPHGGAMGVAAIAWLNWQLKGDAGEAAKFTGPDCALCKDPAWQIKKKNMR